jgi:isopenicillin N synthase-like dioxygenase
MEGLVIYSEKRQRWLRAPFVEGALIVNTGELLKQWSNDRLISVKHYATHIVHISDDNSTQEQQEPQRPRYSIPFFFNANADFRMHCIPTCCLVDETQKYPPFSYSESQALAQGE